MNFLMVILGSAVVWCVFEFALRKQRAKEQAEIERQDQVVSDKLKELRTIEQRIENSNLRLKETTTKYKLLQICDDILRDIGECDKTYIHVDALRNEIKKIDKSIQ